MSQLANVASHAGPWPVMSSLLGLALQGAQVNLAQAQVHQLGQIQAHLHNQQYQQQVQAALAEVLFHTEMRARQVAYVAQQDPLAAAILAHMWQASVGSVSGQMFVNVEGKRAWSAAWGQLEAARSMLDRHPNHGATAHRYLTDMARVQTLGPCPAPQAVAEAERKSEQLWARAKLSAIATPALFIIGLALTVIGGAIGPTAAGLLGLLAMGAILLSFFAAVVAVISFMSKSDVQTEAQQLGSQLRAHQDFEQSEGSFLRALYQQCPWLSRPLPPAEQLPPLSGPGAVVHSFVQQKELVERQTVVARCKFCQGLTPVDGATCRSCGAHKFV
jgi:hypothetical protein